MQNAELGLQSAEFQINSISKSRIVQRDYRAALMEEMASSARYDERTNGPLAQ